MKHKRRISRITPESAAKVLAIVYGSLGLIAAIVMAIAHIARVKESPGGVPVLLFVPVIYAIAGGLSGALGATLYNLAANAVGGIEFEISDE
jgi:hypothetical protein